MNCLNCGKEIKPCKYNKGKKYCSISCGRKHYYKLHREHETARMKEWYMKNKESELKKNKEYREQNRELFDWYHDKQRFDGKRKEILCRDGFICLACGEKNEANLVVHHIDGKNHQKKEANNSIENLMTLCKSCHSRLHRWQEKNVNLKTEEDIVRTIRRLIEANGKS